MFTLLHKWFIDRSVRTGRPPPAPTRRAERRDASLRSFRARLTRLETALVSEAASDRPRPNPRMRQAVLDAAARTPHGRRASAPWRIGPRFVLPIAAAAALAIVAIPAWIAFQEDPGGQLTDTTDPVRPRPDSHDDTGIAVVLSAPREISAAPLLEEARRLAADTRAVRDGLLARIPLIRAAPDQADDRAGDL